MAVDWIKMRADLHTHPKTVRIMSALKADRLRVIGGFHAVWCLFDAHSVDGILDGYDFETLDNFIGWTGFSAAMNAIGWLDRDEKGLSAPRFDEHNGQSAKRRAQEAERKRDVRKASASDADKKRTREEKRREDSKPIKTKQKAPAAPSFDPKVQLAACGVSDQTATDWLTLRSKKRAPVTETVLAAIVREAGKASMPLERVLAFCCTRGWTGFEADWVLKSGGSAGAEKFNPTAHVNRNREPA